MRLGDLEKILSILEEEVSRRGYYCNQKTFEFPDDNIGSGVEDSLHK